MSFQVIEGGKRSLNDVATEEVRAMMARRRMKQADLAIVLGVSQSNVSERLRGRREWQLSELDTLAQRWRVPVGVLLGLGTGKAPTDTDPSGPSGMLPRLDSNQQPSDFASNVVSVRFGAVDRVEVAA